jgi:hypothetical protein
LSRHLNRKAAQIPASAESQKKNLATFPAGLLVVVKSMAQEQEHLAQAYRHIAELKSHILRQRVMLKYVLDTGQPAELAESMLHALEESLRAFEKHRQRILERLPGER